MDHLNTCAKCWAKGVPKVLWEHKGVGPHLTLTRVEGEYKRKHRVHSNQEVCVEWGVEREWARFPQVEGIV